MIAPSCEAIASDRKPIKSGKIVPPNKPMIIRPDISFLRCGIDWMACEKIMENTLELPNPISPIHIYITSLLWKMERPTIAANIIRTLIPKKTFADIRVRIKAPRKQPIVRRMK